MLCNKNQAFQLLTVHYIYYFNNQIPFFTFIENLKNSDDYEDYEDADVNDVTIDVSCKGTFEVDDFKNQVFIKSPRYPENYPLATKCTWRIVAPEGFKVSVIRNSFKIKQYY